MSRRLYISNRPGQLVNLVGLCLFLQEGLLQLQREREREGGGRRDGGTEGEREGGMEGERGKERDREGWRDGGRERERERLISASLP